MKEAALEPLLVVDGIRKHFGGTDTVAVDDLSLAVSPGEIYGLIGPDGAGKTTTMRIVSGLIRADAGRVRAFGGTIPGDERRLRAHVGYMPQQYSLYGDLSVEENLRFFAGMYGVARPVRDEREARLLRMARLEEFRDRPAAALSGGMYKKLALACALVHAPRLLLLDEPTNGVDPISRRELWAFLGELLGEGVAVLVSTPYMDEAERCHRVGLLVEGRLVAEGTPRGLIAAFGHTILEVAGLAAFASPAAFAGKPGVRDVYTVGKKLHVVTDEGPGLTAAIAEMARAAGLGDVRVAEVAPSFEDVFLDLSASGRNTARAGLTPPVGACGPSGPAAPGGGEHGGAPHA